MKYLFVPYEIAIVAKSQGFNEPCLAYYERQQLSNIVEYSNSKLRQENLINGQCLAPTYQQLFDWFREKHDRYLCYTYRNDDGQWLIWFERVSSEDVEYTIHEHSSYYEALNKALEEAFKVINIEDVK